jgi:fused signal recognition particle receptor
MPNHSTAHIPADTIAYRPSASPTMSFREGLRRTRERLGAGFARLTHLGASIDATTLEQIETLLLEADVGVETTDRIIANLALHVKRRELSRTDRLFQALRAELLENLAPVSRPLIIPPSSPSPFVLLMVGVNGTGKTTTIGKLAHLLYTSGRSVAVEAADTFRAAAVEQLIAWGERAGVPVTAKAGGSDPAAVAFEAFENATARGTEVLIVDTAGRLHTQQNLMEQLKKIRRVLGKIDPGAPHETMLVVDATTGQNALNQGARFHEAVTLSGVTLTKLDGTARGGIVFALAERLKVPIRYVGLGEKIDDLKEFDPAEFVDALLDGPKSDH